MVMGDAPFAAALRDQHGKARWTRYRLALLHPCELVKPGDQYGVIVNRNGMTLLYHVLVATPLQLQAGEVFLDRVCACRYDWTLCAQQNGVRPIALHHGFHVIRAIRR